MIENLIREALTGFTARRILDVGPGYAHFSRVSAAVSGAREITFLDFDQNVLAWQMEESRKAGIQAITATMHLNDASLHALRGPFDIIHCQEVLEHLSNATEVLTALRKHLAPAGLMIITVPTQVSERWLKFLNKNYMKDEPFGHVNEFNRQHLKELLTSAALTPRILIPTQPHYFIAHTWFYGSRMRSEASSGKILTGGLRGRVFSLVFKVSRVFFTNTFPRFWGRMFPRNYFVVASAANGEDPRTRL